MVGLTVLGIVLTLHQWDTFRAAVVESFSLNGLLSFGLALALAKALHELAHALVATRLGLRVAHMGVAFVVMFPMLYTDTGESWKLSRSRQRLAIAAAGIVCELALAGLATLGWALSEPGAWRNALLYLATTSWILSLGLNASPFMRFDGYFILSDLLDFPNLHERASAQARVALRRGLWGLDEAWPEHFAPARRRALIAFEWLTWMYRLLLFAGIAATVYFFFFLKCWVCCCFALRWAGLSSCRFSASWPGGGPNARAFPRCAVSVSGCYWRRCCWCWRCLAQPDCRRGRGAFRTSAAGIHTVCGTDRTDTHRRQCRRWQHVAHAARARHQRTH